jgi:hypothetical protein
VSSLTFAILGVLQSYREPSAYVAFALLVGLTFVTAWTLVSRWFAPATLGESIVRVSIVAFAIIVATELVLGALGLLTLAYGLALQTAVCVAATVSFRPRSAVDRSFNPTRVPAWFVGVSGALVAFAIAFGLTHSPLTLYDSLSYHLFFPARWLQEHTLSIVPTPFSDEAQAYAPGNGELFFLWLMLPFRGDLLARLGQLPFALLAALTLYLLARRLGASRHAAVYPPAFFLLARPVVEQAVGANVDLICAATFLASVYLGLIAVERDRARDWVLWGISVGLFAGTKYLALVYLPVLLVFLAMQMPSASLWSLPAMLAFSLPWYGRNWIVAGSPIYPASLSIGGLTIARGAFGRDAMLNTVFHTTDVRLLPPILAHAFGPALFIVWIPAALVGGALLAKRASWPHRVVLLLPVAMTALYWFVLPVNVDSRFLLPALAPALLAFAGLFRAGHTRWNAAMHLLCFTAIAWLIVGARTSIAASTPWFMKGWLALNGVVPSPFVVWFALLAGLTAAAWHVGARHARWAVPCAALVLAGATTALAAGADRWCERTPCAYLDTTSPYIRQGLLDAWEWSAANTRRATIAYTGINLPYPLTGRQLTNRVVYVNTDGRPRWRFHDYDRAYRAGRFDPMPPALAISSGELLPVAARSGPRDDALRPRYERMQGLRDAWIDNLRQLRVNYLFVSRLSAYEIDYVWHNDREFPIEEEWASADPAAFTLLYENPQVRIYAVHVPGGAP